MGGNRRGLDKSRRSTCHPTTRRRDVLLRQRRCNLAEQPGDAMPKIIPSADIHELLDAAPSLTDEQSRQT
jgi:hypothetical protein